MPRPWCILLIQRRNPIDPFSLSLSLSVNLTLSLHLPVHLSVPLSISFCAVSHSLSLTHSLWLSHHCINSPKAQGRKQKKRSVFSMQNEHSYSSARWQPINLTSVLCLRLEEMLDIMRELSRPCESGCETSRTDGRFIGSWTELHVCVSVWVCVCIQWGHASSPTVLTDNLCSEDEGVEV